MSENPVKNTPGPGDLSLAETNSRRFVEALAEKMPDQLLFFQKTLADSKHGACLQTIFGNSPYLSDCLIRQLGFACKIFTQPMVQTLDDLIKELQQFHVKDCKRVELMAHLRQHKQRMALLAGIADLSGEWSLEQVMESLSRFAEICTQISLRYLLLEAHKEERIVLPNVAEPETGCGIIILAMGKLGAHELNYSSDIDLIVFFDSQNTPAQPPDETSSFFVSLTKKLVALLEEKTPDGYVFRTDLRLRPDAGATPVAVSFAAAETYYGSLGQNWERAAMIKARPIAGDPALARDFMALINSWVWRKNLDFAAIQDIHSIKRQINVHKTPKKPARSDHAFAGHNVKLGWGGIREIEFFAQTQQLIFGGRDPRLRPSRTLETLEILRKTGHINAQICEDMTEAYRFLRMVEHRLQMVADQQTHSLPEKDPEFSLIAGFAGYQTPDDFTKALEHHLGRVAGHYAHLFEESTPLSAPGNLVFTGTENDPETLTTLKDMGFTDPARVSAQIRTWHHGRFQATRSARAREILTELVPVLLEKLAKTAHPDEAFLRFDALIASLPAGVPLFSMLHNNPEMLDVLTTIFGMAPRMAEFLKAHPAVMEGLITHDFFGPLPDKKFLTQELARILDTLPHYEECLDAARQWAREKRFHAGVHTLLALTPAEICGVYLADIAETALQCLLPRIQADFAEKHGDFGKNGFLLLAAGRLGSRQMTFDSDLDLIALYQPPKTEASNGEKPLAPSLYYNRLTQRLIAAFSAPTAQGKLYDLDLRLRPQGKDGPLAAALDGFLIYEREQAWCWEHMSLIQARQIYPEKEELTTLLHQILQQRDNATLKKDVAEMRERIRKEFPGNDPWDMKYRPGGLVDIAFTLQFLQINHAKSHLDFLGLDPLQLLERLEATAILSKQDRFTLEQAYLYALRILNFLRLSAEWPFRPELAPAALKESLMRSCLMAPLASANEAINFTIFQEKLENIFKQSHNVYERYCIVDTAI